MSAIADWLDRLKNELAESGASAEEFAEFDARYKFDGEDMFYFIEYVNHRRRAGAISDDDVLLLQSHFGTTATTFNEAPLEARMLCASILVKIGDDESLYNELEPHVTERLVDLLVPDQILKPNKPRGLFDSD